MSAAPSFEPGTVLAGRYRVERVIGRGGMGIVVMASPLDGSAQVAIKVLKASLSSDRTAVARLLREARAVSSLGSEHTVRLLDVGELESGAHFLVFEYLDGVTIAELLRTRAPMPPNEVAWIGVQACAGLAEAHASGIVHRDIKPANLLLARRLDGSGVVKILDYGISKLVGWTEQESVLTASGMLLGSAGYFSPEQILDPRKVDGRADLWSLGVVMYELLTGVPPFHGPTFPALCMAVATEPLPMLPLQTARDDIPVGLAEVIARCLEKNPDARVATAAALSAALAPFCQTIVDEPTWQEVTNAAQGEEAPTREEPTRGR